MSWSPAQYLRFEEERTRAARDLVARIPNVDVESAVDLGCGPGNSTEVLRERYPKARIFGVDSSPDMIAAARRRLPDVAFEIADIRELRTESAFDVILANAVLQWVAAHETLLPSLIAPLSACGSLAVQAPDNLDEPSHRLMRDRERRTLGDEDRRRRRGAQGAARRQSLFSPASPACGTSTSGARPIIIRLPADPMRSWNG